MPRVGVKDEVARNVRKAKSSERDLGEHSVRNRWARESLGPQRSEDAQSCVLAGEPCQLTVE